MKSYTFRPDEVESLFIKHRNNDLFRAMIEAYTTLEIREISFGNIR